MIIFLYASSISLSPQRKKSNRFCPRRSRDTVRLKQDVRGGGQGKGSSNAPSLRSIQKTGEKKRNAETPPNDGVPRGSRPLCVKIRHPR